MADLRLVWNQTFGQCDWTVVDGDLAAGGDLESILLLLLFTDRVAQPDYVPTDGANDRRGWWADTFQGLPIGSRLWQLERRKITNRAALANEANGMVLEATAPMITGGLVTNVTCNAFCPPAGVNSSGNVLILPIVLTQPSGQQIPYQYGYTLS